MTVSTITPTAIDALVCIESVRIGRHRKYLGNLLGLMTSIEESGRLLTPITLTRDSRLLAGERRVEACRRLGWDTIPARFVDSLDEAVTLLRAERDDNTERKEMLPSEKASLGVVLETLEVDQARLRQREGQERGRATRFGLDSSLDEAAHTAKDARARETAALVGDALVMSRSTYHDLSFAYRVAHNEDRPDDERALARAALDAMDSGQGIQPTVTRLRRALNAKHDAQATPPTVDQPEQAPSDGDWVPDPRDGTQRAVDRRKELIASLGAEGLSSYQIAKRIKISDARVREYAREYGIRLPADEAMGRGTRKKIDSNRIVRETVRMFDGLEMSLKLINPDDLDRAEIGDWTASLSDAIRVLNRLKNQLKKEVQ